MWGVRRRANKSVKKIPNDYTKIATNKRHHSHLRKHIEDLGRTNNTEKSSIDRLPIGTTLSKRRIREKKVKQR